MNYINYTKLYTCLIRVFVEYDGPCKVVVCRKLRTGTILPDVLLYTLATVPVAQQMRGKFEMITS